MPEYIFNKAAAGLRSTTLFKKRPWRRCFPANFAKFKKNLLYRTPLLAVSGGLKKLI